MTDLMQQRFNYDALPETNRTRYQAVAEGYRTFVKRTAAGVLEYGEKFSVIRDELRHNKAGGFEGWCSVEGLDRKMVYRFMTVYQRFGNCDNLSQLDISVSALYLLAGPFTPEPAANEFIEHVRAGGPGTYSAAKQIINEYKPIGDLLEEANEAVIEHRDPMIAPITFDPDWHATPNEDEDQEDEEPRNEDGFTARQYQDAQYIESIAIEKHLEVEVRAPEYSGDEWYTPVEYLEAARSVLGTIDLDPASCHDAQALVQANTFYYLPDYDGLIEPWHGRVWLNPPYSYPLVERFTRRAIAAYQSKRIQAAIILTNNCTDAGWFHDLMALYPVCFTRGRIPFWRPGQTTFATRQGQAFFYLGNDVETFYRAFERFGCFPNRHGG